jgi:hypothetical protein
MGTAAALSQCCAKKYRVRRPVWSECNRESPGSPASAFDFHLRVECPNGTDGLGKNERPSICKIIPIHGSNYGVPQVSNRRLLRRHGLAPEGRNSVGRPLVTAQKRAGARADVSRIMNVAVRCFPQHSAMLGHMASSQMVLSLCERRMRRTSL